MDTTKTMVVESKEMAFLVALEEKEVFDIWHAILQEFNIKHMTETVTTKLQRKPPASGDFNPRTESYRIDQQAMVYDTVSDVINTVMKRLKLTMQNVHFLPIWDFFRQYTQRFCDILTSESKLRRKSHYDNYSSEQSNHYDLIGQSLFKRYLKSQDLTVLELEKVFNGRSSNVPTCNLEKLSLAHNQLKKIPADIGRLTKLHTLILSNNRLKNDSIPYTLSFCKDTLHTLLLDVNALDAIPGFVLSLPKLRTLHRHGNQNYFRSTFMWYGCESRERIRTASFSDLDVVATALQCASEVQSLQLWAACSIISSKANYFKYPHLSETAKDYISSVYSMFNICDACNTASLLHACGYFVFTFQNPYLGNTCVPFQHWTCSRECALKVEVPARIKQVEMAKLQLKAYNSYVNSVNMEINPIPEHPPSSITQSLLCGSTEARNRQRRVCTIM